MTRSVVVTGASTGIGRAAVAELAGSGWRVWATVRRDEDARSLLDAHGDAVTPLIMDLTDEGSVLAAGAAVRAAGPLHGLVNNAGVALPSPLEYLPVDVFRRQLEVNLVGQLLVTQAMLPALREGQARDGDARIVMIGSIGGRIAAPMLGPYNAAKFGLVGLSDSLRAELAPTGIRVVVIEPGSIATPIWERGSTAADRLLNTLPEEAAKRYAGQIKAARAHAARQATAGAPPEHTGRVIARALTVRNPQPRQLVGRDAQIFGRLSRLLPYRVLYRITAARPDRTPATGADREDAPRPAP